jgi:STE24 endopeptidase
VALLRAGRQRLPLLRRPLVRSPGRPLNPYAVAVVAALLANHALRLVSDLLTLRTFAPTPPPELRAVFDADRHRRTRAYTQARTRFAMVASTVELAVVLIFWFAGGFGWLDRAVRGLDQGPIATGLLFIGALALGRALVGLPFAWWSTFVIEERFGFNRTTPATFATDLAKQALLAVVLGGPLLAAVLWLFEAAGSSAWLWGWAVAAAAVIGIQVIAPAWLMPLFMRFTPLAAGDLRDAILAYAERVGFPLADVYVVDGSRRSTKANAFFTGLGRHRRIALFDTLLEALDPRAVVGVVAHEVGHWKLGHVPQGMALGILQLGGLCYFLRLILERPALFAAFGIDEPSPWAAIALFGLLLAPVALALSVLLHAWSRRHERQADRFAVETTGDGPALARGLARLAADSLANPTPHPLTVWLEYSHPPVRERIRDLDPAHSAQRTAPAPAQS